MTSLGKTQVLKRGKSACCQKRQLESRDFVSFYQRFKIATLEFLAYFGFTNLPNPFSIEPKVGLETQLQSQQVISTSCLKSKAEKQLYQGKNRRISQKLDFQQRDLLKQKENRYLNQVLEQLEVICHLNSNTFQKIKRNSSYQKLNIFMNVIFSLRILKNRVVIKKQIQKTKQISILHQIQQLQKFILGYENQLKKMNQSKMAEQKVKKQEKNPQRSRNFSKSTLMHPNKPYHKRNYSNAVSESRSNISVFHKKAISQISKPSNSCTNDVPIKKLKQKISSIYELEKQAQQQTIQQNNQHKQSRCFKQSSLKQNIGDAVSLSMSKKPSNNFKVLLDSAKFIKKGTKKVDREKESNSSQKQLVFTNKTIKTQSFHGQNIGQPANLLDGTFREKGMPLSLSRSRFVLKRSAGLKSRLDPQIKKSKVRKVYKRKKIRFDSIIPHLKEQIHKLSSAVENAIPKQGEKVVEGEIVIISKKSRRYPQKSLSYIESGYKKNLIKRRQESLSLDESRSIIQDENLHVKNSIGKAENHQQLKKNENKYTPKKSSAFSEYPKRSYTQKLSQEQMYSQLLNIRNALNQNSRLKDYQSVLFRQQDQFKNLESTKILSDIKKFENQNEEGIIVDMKSSESNDRLSCIKHYERYFSFLSDKKWIKKKLNEAKDPLDQVELK